MPIVSKSRGSLALLALLALPASVALNAQAQEPARTDIVVTGEAPPDPSGMAKGPEIKGIITARSGDKIKVTASDGTATVISLAGFTKIKGGGGLFGGKNKPTTETLVTGLPVTVKTLQGPDGLWASQVSFKGGDLKTAQMIHGGTAQQFDEQSKATEALRGRMGDIDNYNIKGTTNVYFDTGKWVLTPQAKVDICAAAAQAEATSNALILVVGYTDSTGSDETNQTLSEKRATAVIRHLQQVCHWKPYRMLTPTGMASADPLADNSTPEGRAQNRRVSINILVSKAVDVD